MKHVLRNITRLKARSFLTFAIMFSVMFLSMFGNFIIRLCEDNRERFYGPLDGAYHVTDEEYQPFLTYGAAEMLEEDVDAINKISAIKWSSGYFEDAEYIGDGLFTRDRVPGDGASIVPDTTGGTPKVYYSKGFRIVGVTSMDILSEVYSGKLTITQGTPITEENNMSRHNKIVISEELAEKNGLSVGDTVSLHIYSPFLGDEGIDRRKHDEADCFAFIIGGIYRHSEDNSAGVSAPWEINANHVYVPISVLDELSRHKYVKHLQNNGAEDPILVPDALYFHLNSATAASGVENALNEIGFRKNIVLTEFVSDAASSPSARLSQVISAVLVCIVAVGMGVLLLAILFNMKARHKELAVLAALGQNRHGIALSFFAELLLLGTASLLAGGLVMVGVIRLLAVPLTQYLYSAEITSQLTADTATKLLFEDISGSYITEKAGEFSHLIEAYFVPSFLFALMQSLIVFGILYLVISAYIFRINALSGVGGKE